MANKRVGGIIELKVNGSVYAAKGSFSWNLGRHKRESITGHDSYHGFKELPQVGFIEGTITDSSEISVETLVNVVDATVTLALPNGKIFVLRNAIFTGEGTVTTEEGEIAVRFEGQGEEVR